MIIGGSSVDF
jgi:hypothetical protein